MPVISKQCCRSAPVEQQYADQAATPKSTTHSTTQTSLQLTLVCQAPAFGLRHMNPLCLKVEMLLQSLQLPYQLVTCSNNSFTAAAVLHRSNSPGLWCGHQYIQGAPDIVEFLNRYTRGQVYQTLSPAQQSHGSALLRLAEEHLRWHIIASHWLDDGWWPHTIRALYADLPALWRPVWANAQRKSIRRAYQLPGLPQLWRGNNTDPCAANSVATDFAALDYAVCRAEPFLCGAQLSVYDCSVAAHVAVICHSFPATQLTRMIADYPALFQYSLAVQQATGVSACTAQSATQATVNEPPAGLDT